MTIEKEFKHQSFRNSALVGMDTNDGILLAWLLTEKEEHAYDDIDD